MAHINLLPWRAERRKQQQREFAMAAFFTAAVAVVIVFLVHTYFEGVIQYQQERNQFLHNEITMLNKKISKIKALDKTKRELLNRMKIVEQLQASRPAAVHMLSQLVATLPPGLYLTSFSQQGSVVHIAGVAESNARVSEYMRNLDASPWFSHARLEVVINKKTPIGSVSDFKLNVKFVNPTLKRQNKRGR